MSGDISEHLHLISAKVQLIQDGSGFWCIHDFNRKPEKQRVTPGTLLATHFKKGDLTCS